MQCKDVNDKLDEERPWERGYIKNDHFITTWQNYTKEVLITFFKAWPHVDQL